MMHCVQMDIIEEYLQGEMAPSERSEFERHLGGCANCRQMLERERRFDELLRGQALAAAPANFHARVMKALESSRFSFSFTDRIWMIGLGLVLAAIGSLIGYGGRGIIGGAYDHISQLLTSTGLFEMMRRDLPAFGTGWLDQLPAANLLSLLNFFVAAVILCWGLWQMVKVLRR